MALDSSDILNSLTGSVISTLQGFVSLDADWENPTFKKGFPTWDVDLPLTAPLIAVYARGSDVYDVAYDNIVDTNNLYFSDPGFEFTRGVSLVTSLYIDTYVSVGTSSFPSASGGAIVAERIAGKIQTRLMLNPECLDSEITVEPPVTMMGPLWPADTNDPDVVLYRVEATLEVLVTQTLNSSNLIVS
jgi:hypothetical protein